MEKPLAVKPLSMPCLLHRICVALGLVGALRSSVAACDDATSRKIVVLLADLLQE